ncbi:MAG TPA: hypothetical protein VKE91_09285, partial [Blastocatellia bacterium]|nr:hypothetical protein [Blastocatellia bacterium]
MNFNAHAFNVKRLRPVEITTFDYECPPQTGSLWISEGLTSYNSCTSIPS